MLKVEGGDMGLGGHQRVPRPQKSLEVGMIIQNRVDTPKKNGLPLTMVFAPQTSQEGEEDLLTGENWGQLEP